MQKYERYKDSGIEWLGEIPKHWALGRIATCFKERRKKVSDIDYPPLSVTKLGVFPQRENVAKSSDGDNRKLVIKGDFVINSRSDRKGSSGLAKQDGSVSLINIVLKPVSVIPDFSEYLFKSHSFIEEFYRVGHGIVADLWTTRFDDIKNSLIAFPPLTEQTQIANFLDNKILKIDTAVLQKEKLINLLKEQKQAIINQAVTKGLNKNIKFKDSGVEWIGEIPEHWEVKKLKYLVSLSNEKVESKNSDFEYIGMENIESFTGKIIKNNNQAEGLSNKFYKNDILFGKLRPYLTKVYLCKNEGICSAEFLVYKSVNILNLYLKLIMLSNSFISLINMSTYGTKMPRANAEFINNQLIPLPPLNEQQQIANYIENQN